ncbi:clathrin coat assembly protein ap17 [Coprinopsis cinerea AmutBmut pab1-1]|nr:clathrin coat assembly protein ap17 [Coprinopsis cinerea AmutBmut pab1-1]
MINYFFLLSRQGKLRLSKWYITLPGKDKAKIVREVSQLVLGRPPRVCNFLEHKGRKIVYKRYASLFFVCEIAEGDNELLTLEIIHRYVEILDRYFGNVCELDIIFNFQQAYSILDELVVAGELQESSRDKAFKAAKAAQVWEEADDMTEKLQDILM